MRIFAIIFATISLSFLNACASQHLNVERTEAILPLSQAWVDGYRVEYVTTDISDALMAQMAGVNYVPRLADAITHSGSKSILERVYKFPRSEQISIFQSGPKPTGAANLDRNYSPLWRLVLVQWTRPEKVHELKSEVELQAAEDLGDVSLQVTEIVVNCPIIRGGDKQALKDVR
jgi:hypothetical protein